MWYEIQFHAEIVKRKLNYDLPSVIWCVEKKDVVSCTVRGRQNATEASGLECGRRVAGGGGLAVRCHSLNNNIFIVSMMIHRLSLQKHNIEGNMCKLVTQAYVCK